MLSAFSHHLRTGDWFYVETACIVLLTAFAANYYFGRQANRRIALSWSVH